MITNEEKAKSMAYYHCDRRTCKGEVCETCKYAKVDKAVLEMAQWKDEQFAAEKQALIEKMDSILDAAEAMRETAIGRHLTGGWYWRKWAEWGYRKAIEAMKETK